jgi:hypothetical protein
VRDSNRLASFRDCVSNRIFSLDDRLGHVTALGAIFAIATVAALWIIIARLKRYHGILGLNGSSSCCSRRHVQLWECRTKRGKC